MADRQVKRIAAAVSLSQGLCNGYIVWSRGPYYIALDGLGEKKRNPERRVLKYGYGKSQGMQRIECKVTSWLVMAVDTNMSDGAVREVVAVCPITIYCKS